MRDYLYHVQRSGYNRSQGFHWRFICQSTQRFVSSWKRTCSMATFEFRFSWGIRIKVKKKKKKEQKRDFVKVFFNKKKTFAYEKQQQTPLKYISLNCSKKIVKTPKFAHFCNSEHTNWQCRLPISYIVCQQHLIALNMKYYDKIWNIFSDYQKKTSLLTFYEITFINWTNTTVMLYNFMCKHVHLICKHVYHIFLFCVTI